MPAIFDPANDLMTVADGLAPVTVNRPGTAEVTNVAKAMRRAITVREAQASRGKYTTSDTVFHLPAAQISEPPQLGDRIVDGEGQAWTVLEVQRALLNTRWRCITRNLEISAGLNEIINIERAIWNKCLSGAPLATWVEAYAGLPARIQPAVGEIETRHDRRLMRTTHKVYVADPVDVNENCRVIGPDQKVYHIARFESADRIDTLNTIHVVESPWPL